MRTTRTTYIIRVGFLHHPSTPSLRYPSASLQVVIWQGEAGDNMYLVEDGKFEAAIRPTASLALSDMLSLEGIDTMGEVVASYAQGTIFGERALMQNMPRAASVRCVAEGRLWAIDRLTFRKVTLGEALAQPKTAQSTQGEEEEDAAEVAGW